MSKHRMSRHQVTSESPFTTGQAADYCHVSQTTIINWIKEGKLNGYTTPGGHYRIPRPDLVSFLETHGMPVDAALTASEQPRLLVLSNNPRIRDLAQTLGRERGFEVSLVANDYAASAEAARSEPDVVIVDTRASSDPSGFCQWLNETAKDATLLMVGNTRNEPAPLAVEADAYLSQGDGATHEALSSLEKELEVLLR